MRPLALLALLALPSLHAATTAPAPAVEVTRETGYLDENPLIRWSTLTPDRIAPDIEGALARARAELAAIADTPAGQCTFDSVVLAFENACIRFENTWSKVSFQNDIDNSPARRAAFNAVRPKVDAFESAITRDPRLWATIKAYAETPEAQALTGTRRRLLDELIKGFQKSGADLPETQKNRLTAIDEELSRLTQKYAENILDGTNAWQTLVTDEARLAGLPASARAAALQSAREKGLGSDEKPVWRFTLHEPSRIPVLLYAEDDALRRTLWEGTAALGSTAPFDNREILRKIVSLRHEKARLLGRAHFADLITEDRMAKSGANALAFVERLHAKAKPAFDRETAELEAYKSAKTGRPAAPLTPWELHFFAEKQRRECYDFDSEALRPYLAISAVESGLFLTAERLYGVKIRARDTVHRDPATGVSKIFHATAATRIGKSPAEVWHPSVKYFELYDGERLLGAFYTDWFPRESKRGGAWMCGLISGARTADGAPAPHVGLMAGNFSPPVGDAEALISHHEATTAFHEFGHLMHHLLSRVEYRSLAGTRVAWDFVELPSQLMENWCWDKEGLLLFARHRATGEPIPDELVKKLVAARHYRAASSMMRHLGIARIDLDFHTKPDAMLARDPDAYWNTDLAAYQPRTSVPQPAIATRLPHLFKSPVGYASGYYSYKWAEVLEADAFSRFQKEGLLNPATGRAFRDAILSKGNSEPAEQLFRDFMGRDPDPDALLRRDGLL